MAANSDAAEPRSASRGGHVVHLSSPCFPVQLGRPSQASISSSSASRVEWGGGSYRYGGAAHSTGTVPGRLCGATATQCLACRGRFPHDVFLSMRRWASRIVEDMAFGAESRASEGR